MAVRLTIARLSDEVYEVSYTVNIGHLRAERPGCSRRSRCRFRPEFSTVFANSARGYSRVQAVLGKNVLQLTQESFLMGERPLVGLDLVQGSALGPRARSLAGASSAKERERRDPSQCCAIFVLSGRHHCRRVNPV